MIPHGGRRATAVAGQRRDEHREVRVARDASVLVLLLLGTSVVHDLVGEVIVLVPGLTVLIVSEVILSVCEARRGDAEPNEGRDTCRCEGPGALHVPFDQVAARLHGRGGLAEQLPGRGQRGGAWGAGAAAQGAAVGRQHHQRRKHGRRRALRAASQGPLRRERPEGLRHEAAAVRLRVVHQPAEGAAGMPEEAHRLHTLRILQQLPHVGSQEPEAEAHEVQRDIPAQQPPRLLQRSVADDVVHGTKERGHDRLSLRWILCGFQRPVQHVELHEAQGQHAAVEELPRVQLLDGRRVVVQLRFGPLQQEVEGVRRRQLVKHLRKLRPPPWQSRWGGRSQRLRRHRYRQRHVAADELQQIPSREAARAERAATYAAQQQR
mmetsp:Transcript_3713/g.7513  ORF Transcript_3713/g.7513 Transcript_3713/m.7513 type:complete len:378 (-) Transcript_3713:355-1488(-)